MSLGKNIKLMRKNAGWKKSELAEKCGVSKEIVSEWEKDKREPSVREYKSLSKLFDVTIDKLMENEEIADRAMEQIYKDWSFYIGYVIKNLYGFEREQLGWDVDLRAVNTISMLYCMMRSRYMSEDGKVYKKYLVKNSTEKERYNWVKAINGQRILEKEGPFEAYIDGKCEINQCFEDLEKELRATSEKLQKKFDKKVGSELFKTYKNMKWDAGILKNHDTFSEKKLEENMDELNKIISELNSENMAGKLLIFFGNEIKQAFYDEDEKKLAELIDDMKLLEKYIWYKIPVDENDTDNTKAV